MSHSLQTQGLLGNLGGTLGIYMGLALIVLFELIELGFDLAVAAVNYNAKKGSKKPNSRGKRDVELSWILSKEIIGLVAFWKSQLQASF